MPRNPEALQLTDLDPLRRRDPAALEAEFVAHRRTLERAARRLGLAPADVDDVTQSVWMTFLEIVPRFEGRSRVRTFLFGILRREAAAARRRGARSVTTDPAELEAVGGAGASDAEAMVLSAELGRAASRCIDQLPVKERRAVDLKFLRDRSAADVGRQLGVTANYLGVLLHLARAHLRDCLGAHLA